MLKQVASMEKALHQMQCAVSKGRSVPYCLRLWGSFIRLRDGNRCVNCHTRRNLAAHHILRKSFLIESRFQTGNGITLCKSCHRDAHKAFNRKPNLELPMDAEGGENIDLLIAFFSILLSDAKHRHLLRDDFYYLSDQVLQVFKMLQGFAPTTHFPGNRLEQAFLIWRQTPRNTFKAILGAIGIVPPEDFIQTGAFTSLDDL
jgi:hypothetical protein